MNDHWRHPSDPAPFRMRTRRQILCDQALVAFICFLAAIAMVLALLWAGGVIAAELPKEANKATIECPDVGQPCKVLLINSQEENLLIRQGGILDTASAGRYIELGNVVSYFRMKLMQAPQGEVKQPPVPEKKPAAPQAVVPPAN